jgi:hypothetical protein
MMVCIPSPMMRVLIIYPPSQLDLDFSLVSKIVNGVPLYGKQKDQQVLYGYAAQDQKR